MALRLTVRRDAFRRHVSEVAASFESVVPVVKGNGYGIGRKNLVGLVHDLLPSVTTLAVGTLHEVDDVPGHLSVHIMNPVGDMDLAATPSIPNNAIPTVGSLRDVEILARHGWSGRVAVKLASSMRRFGAVPAELPDLLRKVERLGGIVHAFSIHPPTAGTDAERIAEIRSWLPLLPHDAKLSISHLASTSVGALRTDDPRRDIEVRLGTALWHGTKEHFALQADVVRTETCLPNQTAGYRRTAVPGKGTLVVIGAGTAHGVTPLANGDSPFHFARTRLALVEAPYMHSAIGFVPAGEPCPEPGDVVDVQRPLTTIHPDLVEWIQ